MSDEELFYLIMAMKDSSARKALKVSAGRNTMRARRRAFVVEDLADEEFCRLFCVSKSLYTLIASIMQPVMNAWRTRSFERRNMHEEITYERQILAALYVLGSGSYQSKSEVHSLLGMSQRSVSRSMRTVVPLIVEAFRGEIKFPTTPEERTAVANGFSDLSNGNFMHCLGAIGSTHIKILRPTESENEKAYLTKKRIFSLNVHLICDSNLRILHVCANSPGSMPNSAIWSKSSAREKMLQLVEEKSGEFFLIGNSSYELETFLLTPIAKPSKEAECKYNEVHSSLLNVTDKCFEVLKSRFKILAGDRRVGYDHIFVTKIVSCCAILHNLCIKNNIPVETSEQAAHIRHEAPPHEDTDPSPTALSRRSLLVAQFT